MYKPALSCYTQ